MVTLIRSEVRKITTTRMWWILLLSMVAYVGVFMAFVAFIATSTSDSNSQNSGLSIGTGAADTASLYSFGASMGMVFPLLMGTLSLTSEFRHRTIGTTFLAEPRRGRVLVAKVVTSVAMGGVYGIALALASIGATAAVLAIVGEPTYLFSGPVLQLAVRMVAAMALWSLLGLGFASVLTNQIAAIVVVLAFTQLVEPIITVVLLSVSWGSGVLNALPGRAGSILVGSPSFTMTGTTSDLPSLWLGAAVLAAWAIVFLAIGRVTSLGKDLT